MPLVALRPERGSSGADEGRVGDGQHGQIERGIDQPPCLVGSDVHTELLEQPEDRAGLGGARGVVVAGDQHDGGVRQRLAQALELPEREDDGGVGGADRVKQVAGHDHRVGPGGDHRVHRGTECVRDVGLALIDAGGGLAVVLTETEMRIGDVGQFHPY